MERLNTHIRTADSAFQETPEVLHAVRVNRAVNVLRSVVDYLVSVLGVKPVVREQLIRHDFRTAPNVLADHWGKIALAPRLNVLQVDASGIPFEQAKNDLLSEGSATVDLSFPLGAVHIPCCTTDESLIGFDGARHLVNRSGVHGVADALVHKPCCLLGHSKRAPDLITGDSILAVPHHPHGREPLAKANRGILEDRTNLHGELLAAFEASPGETSLDKGQPFGFATRTFGTVRPLDFGNRFKAYHWVRKVLDCFHQTAISVEVNRFHKPILLPESV